MKHKFEIELPHRQIERDYICALDEISKLGVTPSGIRMSAFIYDGIYDSLVSTSLMRAYAADVEDYLRNREGLSPSDAVVFPDGRLGVEVDIKCLRCRVIRQGVLLCKFQTEDPKLAMLFKLAARPI